MEEAHAAGARRVMRLSDKSQAVDNEVVYPDSETFNMVELTEVVRSSERVVAGAMQFQRGAEEKLLTKCHHDSVGPALRTYLFDVEGD